MNNSKLIIENKNLYDDGLDAKLDKVNELVIKNNISPKLATALIAFLIRNQINNVVKNNVKNVLHNKERKNKWVIMNYSKIKTSYL